MTTINKITPAIVAIGIAESDGTEKVKNRAGDEVILAKGFYWKFAKDETVIEAIHGPFESEYAAKSSVEAHIREQYPEAEQVKISKTQADMPQQVAALIEGIVNALHNLASQRADGDDDPTVPRELSPPAGVTRH